MSRWVKGFLLWVINNVLAIMTMDSFLVFLKTFSSSSFLRFLLFGLPWIITGSMIVVAFASIGKSLADLDKEKACNSRSDGEKICTACGGDMRLKKISSTFCTSGGNITIDNVEAYVCEKCDEEVYASEEAKRIEQIIAAARK